MTSWHLSRRAGVHHELGEYQKQRELAQLGYQHYPNDGAFYSQEVGALIGLGRLGEVDDVILRCEKASVRSGSVGAVLNHAARELAAHGHADAATAMAKRGAAWYKSEIGSGKPTAALRGSYAAMLLRAGDCAQAAQIQKELLRERPESLETQGSYGVTLAMCGGSRAEAQKIADALGKVNRPFLCGAHQYERARVLAATARAPCAPSRPPMRRAWPGTGPRCTSTQPSSHSATTCHSSS